MLELCQPGQEHATRPRVALEGVAAAAWARQARGMKLRASLLLALLAGALALALPDAGRAGGDRAPEAPAPGAAPEVPTPWPPQKGKPYPDLELQDASGKRVRLSSLKGKVLLIEPIGTACPGCNAYAGGAARGGFKGSGVQQGLPAVSELLERFAQLSLERTPDLVLVQLLLFDTRSQVGHAPKVEEGAEWVRHFQLEGKKNVLALVGTDALANQASYAMVPGFQVVDRSFVLRWDGTGHKPADDPYQKVLASIPALLAEKARRP